MHKVILVVLMSFSMLSIADIEVGIYEGVIEVDGATEKCIMGVNDVRFTNNVKHPLNERVDVQVSFSETSFELSHLPIINEVDVTVKPEGGVLKGSYGTSESVEAVSLKMIHSDDYTGPDSVTYISIDVASGTKVKKVCKNLRKN
jgi:hypothetical protein